MEWVKDFDEFKAYADCISDLPDETQEALCDAVLSGDGFIHIENYPASQTIVSAFMTKLAPYADVQLEHGCCDSATIIVEHALESIFVPYEERNTATWKRWERIGFTALVMTYLNQYANRKWIKSLHLEDRFLIRGRMHELGIEEKFDRWLLKTNSFPEMGVTNSTG